MNNIKNINIFSKYNIFTNHWDSNWPNLNRNANHYAIEHL